MSRWAVLIAGFLFVAEPVWAQPPVTPPAKEAKPDPKKAAKAAMEMLAERAEIFTNLAYVENGHQRQKLDLFVPKTDDGPLPLIVWIHGGGWQGGSKDACPMAIYVTRGYVVASINYRLSQHAIYPAQLDDCQAALRWLRKNASKYKIDPDRIGVSGASAGGHLAALVGAAGSSTKGKPDRVDVQCVVDVFGPANFLTIWPQSDPKTTVVKHHELDSPEGRLFGGPIPEKTALAKQASPMTYVSKNAPPFLILHGKKDRVVPWQQSEELHEALKKAGADSTLILVDDAGHDGNVAGPNGKKIAEFFDKHLKKAKGVTTR
jgi:acetyl esterase/lipase